MCKCCRSTATADDAIPIEAGALSAGRPAVARRFRRIPQRTAFALLLSGVAGSVDAIGYLNLFQLFIAHMSGNTVRVGIFIGEGNWGAMFERAFPIPMMVLGVMAGGVLAEAGLRRRFSATLSALLALECLLLAAFAGFGPGLLAAAGASPTADWHFYLAVALPTLAMGLQNAALRRVGGNTVRTTFVTGMLIDLSEAAVACLFCVRDALAAPGARLADARRRLSQDNSLPRFLLYTAIWLLYVAGAVAGTTIELRAALTGLALPIAVLLALAVWNAARPILPPGPD